MTYGRFSWETERDEALRRARASRYMPWSDYDEQDFRDAQMLPTCLYDPKKSAKENAEKYRELSKEDKRSERRARENR